MMVVIKLQQLSFILWKQMNKAQLILFYYFDFSSKTCQYTDYSKIVIYPMYTAKSAKRNLSWSLFCEVKTVCISFYKLRITHKLSHFLKLGKVKIATFLWSASAQIPLIDDALLKAYQIKVKMMETKMPGMSIIS
ncbi:hypothetical protein HI914_03563 [Erysiphe necator]|nr:hypothetical protein HI914_03563 [Erysiphe necator]